jgi:hypothetical protein
LRPQPGPGDEAWTDDDVRQVLEWQDERDMTCVCGHLRTETMTPDSFGRYDSEPLVCHACQARDQAAQQYRDGKGDPHGVYFTVTDREA